MKGIAGLALAFVFVVGCSKNPDVGVRVDPPATPAKSTATTPGQTGNPAKAAPLIAQTPTPAPGASQLAISSKPPSTPTPSKPVKSANGLYTFKFSPKEGEVNYKLTMSMDMGQSKPMDMSQTISNKTTKQTDGSYKVESTTNGMGFGGNGQSVTTTSIIDSHGKVLKMETGGKTMGSNDPLASLAASSTALPNHPVKIGDTWVAKGGKGKSTAAITCKLLKVENVGGSDVATIQIVSMKFPQLTGAQVAIGGPSQLVMDLSTGELESMKMGMTMGVSVPSGPPSGATPGKPTKMKFKMNVKMEKQ